MSKILLLNGPNLNLLGKREPEVYGHDTLDDVLEVCQEFGSTLGFSIEAMQSNYEGEIIEAIQNARGVVKGIIINPAAFSHTSVGILDALLAFEGKVIEVHITNIHKREEFRHFSYVSRRADGIIMGLGINGYRLALNAMSELLQ